MKPFSSQVFGQRHTASPLEFLEAESKHFKCKYVYRDEDTVLQFDPTIIPTRKDFVSVLKGCLSKLIGEDQAKEAVVEMLEDELLERGESVYVSVPGFTRHNINNARLLVTKLLTETHERLS
jgi:hypothetical protein